jgi:hypothetical protein
MSSVTMACEYGPMALGALLVETIFLPSVVYIPASFIWLFSKVILLRFAGLCKLTCNVTLSASEESLTSALRDFSLCSPVPAALVQAQVTK